MAGFFASRFLKASSSGRYQSSSLQGPEASRQSGGASSAGYVSPAALSAGQTVGGTEQSEPGETSRGVAGGIG